MLKIQSHSYWIILLNPHLLHITLSDHEIWQIVSCHMLPLLGICHALNQDPYSYITAKFLLQVCQIFRGNRTHVSDEWYRCGIIHNLFFFWSRQRKDFYLKKQAKSSQKLILFVASLVVHLSQDFDLFILLFDIFV